jgi:hypothetical protein
MTLLNFFRKKPAPFIITYNGDKSGKELLGDGILFEGTNTFIKWGADIEDIVKNFLVRKERRTDRTIYHFGKQTILNGLDLDLSIVFWDAKNEDFKLLGSVEFLSIGDTGAKERIEVITSHLEKEIGNPAKNEIINSDILKEWRINDVRILLNFFERYSNKLHFQIIKVG